MPAHLALALLVAQVVPALSDLPALDRAAGVQAHYVSSHDRSGGNDDGFDGTYSALYVDERGEHVIVDVKGPGTLYNLWFTSRVNGRSPLGWGRLRFYFDGETVPRIDMDADELFSGRNQPFVAPFVYHAFQSTGGYVSYLPLPFQDGLKITTERRVGFYNAYYHTYPSDRAVRTWTGDEDLTALARAWSQPGAPPTRGPDDDVLSGVVSLPSPLMPDGEPEPSRTVVFERDAGGVIRALRFNPLFPLTPYQLGHVVLRAYWDGEEEPAIDAPLGHFFGSGLGEADVDAVPLGMSSSGPYYCYFPMPFWSSARIELINENPEPVPEIWWEVELGANDYAQDVSGHFFAKFHKEWPTTPGTDYSILDAEGRGLYLGQMMTVEPLRAEIKRWWEGDLRIRLDGREHPVFHGTGHEDEYLGGWSNEWLMNPYSLPMHGEPMTRALRQVDFQWSAATTVYRFFVGGIPFVSGITVSTEHGARNTASAMYSSVAYYYGRPDAIERLAVIEPAALRASRPEGVTRLTLDAGDGTTGLRLRRFYRPAERQLAEVWVGGELIGVWYDGTADAHATRAESDFLLPSSIVGRGAIQVEIRPLDANWSELGYELWGMH